jgi:uncharacterized protein (DUF1697 family)
MNAKMPELQRCFEAAGFTDVSTVLSSGNVVFGARAAAAGALERTAEAAMKEHLDRSFLTIVRPIDVLRAVLASDPFRAFPLPAGSKLVVTFLRRRSTEKLSLPLEIGGARILCVQQSEVFTSYVPSPRGAVFMTLIEKTFGKEVTTRTWETIKKVVARAS